MNSINRLELYCGLMEEIKYRIKFVDTCLLPSNAPAIFIEESCLLQFRLVYEIVAIACVAAQSNHINIKQLEREWSAHKIMPRLEKLNPEFFPKAVRLKRMPDQNFEMKDINPAPMSKAEFLASYGRMGDKLHRGTIRKTLSGQSRMPGRKEDLANTSRRIKYLLESHRIPSPDLKTNYVCILENPPDGRSVIATVQSL